MSPKGPRSYVPQRPPELSVPQGARCCVPQWSQVLSVPQRPLMLSVPQGPRCCVPQRPKMLCPSEVPGIICPSKANKKPKVLVPSSQCCGETVVPAGKKATLLRHGLRRGRGILVPSYFSFLLQEMNCLTVPQTSVIMCHLNIVPRET